jgi:hypothetical protein
MGARGQGAAEAGPAARSRWRDHSVVRPMPRQHFNSWPPGTRRIRMHKTASLLTSSRASRARKWFIISIAAILLVALVYIGATRVLDLSKARAAANARNFAATMLETIPPPAGSIIGGTWSNDKVNSYECYFGFARSLYGTDLSQASIISYYAQYFEGAGWRVDPVANWSNGEPVPPGARGLVVWPREADPGYRADVELCDQSSPCDKYGDAPPGVGAAMQQHYSMVYWVTVTYRPSEVRLAPVCGCCGPG